MSPSSGTGAAVNKGYINVAHKFAEIAFTPTVRSIQEQEGSRSGYARMDSGDDYNHRLGYREVEFIGKRDSFYMASVGESGWPYVQHRGGPVGFMKVLDAKTIGFADYSGNRQYVSTGNFKSDDRVSMFFMDYPNRRRLKMLGRVRSVALDEAEMLAKLEDESYPAQLERGFIIQVEAYDWNCPQHITPRFTDAEIKGQLAEYPVGPGRNSPQPTENSTADKQEQGAVLGEGPLPLVVSGIRQLAPRVRAFELRDPEGGKLPLVAPGSHLRIPVTLPSGELVDRHYSIASNPARSDAYEIAVLREEKGSGGSAAVHASYQIGTRVNVDMPGNHFGLHDDSRPALLIAGGIGITPIKSMALALESRGAKFELHYAGRSRKQMAFRDRLERQLEDRLHVYSAEQGDRLDIDSVLAGANHDAVIYVCGPQRLTDAVKNTARDLGIARERVRLELFA